MKKNNFKKYAPAVLMLIISFAVFLYVRNIAHIKDEFFVVLNIAFVLVILVQVFVIYVVYFKNDFKMENAYAVSAVLLGITITLIIPVATVPDEYTHIYMAYQISNEMLLIDEGQSDTLIMRKGDFDICLQSNNPKREYFNDYYGKIFEKTTDGSLVETRIIVAEAPKYLYFFSGLGITVGRLLGCGTIMTFLLGRLFNMLVFISVIYFSIKKIPFGKSIVYAWALLPIMVQQAGSFSYDCIINALCILVISLTIEIMYGDSEKNKFEKIKDILYLILACILLLPCKNGAFIPVVLMPCMIIVKHVKKRKDKIKTLLNKIPFKKIFWGAISVLAIGVVVAGSLKVLSGMLQNADGNGIYIGWANEYAFPIGYYIKYPLKLAAIIINTFKLRTLGYIRQMFGGSLGWLDVNIPIVFPAIFIVIVLYASLRKKTEQPLISMGNRVWMMLVFIGVCACAMAGMLLYWTPMSGEYIEGVQGRYFLPALVPAMLAISPSKLSVGENRDKIIASSISVMYIFVVASVLLDKL